MTYPASAIAFQFGPDRRSPLLGCKRPRLRVVGGVLRCRCGAPVQVMSRRVCLACNAAYNRARRATARRKAAPPSGRNTTGLRAECGPGGGDGGAGMTDA